jgi:hypothetical protein
MCACRASADTTVQASPAYRLRQIDRRGRRLVDGQERDNAVAQITIAKRRGEHGEHDKAEILSQISNGHNRWQIARTKQQDLAIEFHVRKQIQYFGTFDSTCRQAKDNEVRQMCVEHRTQFAGPRALADEKSEFFQSLRKECSNVLLAVDDANGRPDLSPTEDMFGRFSNHGMFGRFSNQRVCHGATLR